MPSAVRPAATPAEIKTEELKPEEVRERASEEGVECVAPIIPMKLVAPVATAAASGRAQGPTWGVRAVGADRSRFTGKGIVVAVLDTGIQADHPAFDGVQIVQKNFTDGPDEDRHGHGTHCAGTIFGREVDGVRIGVAPGVKKGLIGKDGAESDKIVDAVDWAFRNGADVISMSLGMDYPGFVQELIKKRIPAELATSMALEGYRRNIILFERLAKFIAARNEDRTPVLIAAAGNESRRDKDPDFEIAVSPPAVSDGFVSVAALGEGPRGFKMADFSNFGARVAGPGVEVVSAKLRGRLEGMSGTSMATPHVAGVAALWAEKLGTPVNGEMLVNMLVGNANFDGLDEGVKKRHVGTGLVRAPQN